MTSTTGALDVPVRRFDPRRRERIIRACLHVVTEVGVDGTTHRRVADRADVPLGSMTYHFASRRQLLHEAFEQFAKDASAEFGERMATVVNATSARAEVARTIITNVHGDQRDLILTHELYTAAARDPFFRDITSAWMTRTRTVLERHFDPVTACIIDALLAGMTTHRALGVDPQNDAVVYTAIERVAKNTRRA